MDGTGVSFSSPARPHPGLRAWRKGPGGLRRRQRGLEGVAEVLMGEREERIMLFGFTA